MEGPWKEHNSTRRLVLEQRLVGEDFVIVFTVVDRNENWDFHHSMACGGASLVLLLFGFRIH